VKQPDQDKQLQIRRITPAGDPEFLIPAAGNGHVCGFPVEENRMNFINALDLDRKSGGSHSHPNSFGSLESGSGQEEL
jgi:hypothetical protein